MTTTESFDQQDFIEWIEEVASDHEIDLDIDDLDSETTKELQKVYIDYKTREKQTDNKEMDELEREISIRAANILLADEGVTIEELEFDSVVDHSVEKDRS